MGAGGGHQALVLQRDWTAFANKLHSQQGMTVAATTVKKPSRNSPVKRARP